MKRTFTFFFFILTCSLTSKGQYALNGSATQSSCNCFELSNKGQQYANGSVYNLVQLDLNKPFNLLFNVFSGCENDYGGDGMAFILQPHYSSGYGGEHMGYGGIDQSIAVTLDTWQNETDPPYDHIAIQKNGNVKHGNDLAEPVRASAESDNIEDCKSHTLRITWDPATKKLKTFFDNVFRLEAQVDLVKDIFNNDPKVRWGFSGATGGATNLQRFCTALNPDFVTNTPNDGTCFGNAISLKEQSLSYVPITSYTWELGDGNTRTGTDVSSYVYNQPGEYRVKLSVTDTEGCRSDTVKLITIGSTPNAAFNVFDTCFKSAPRITVPDDQYGVSYQWFLNGKQYATEQLPELSGLPPGAYTLKAVATSDVGCTTNATTTKSFKIKKALAHAGRDTIVLNNVPFQLHGRGEGTAVWSPSTGLSRTDLLNPTGTLTEDQAYELQLTTAEGCIAKDSVLVRVSKTSSIYVPTGFTPNNDGLNDVLRPTYIGIKKIHYFTIFNRWGQTIFTTNNSGKGWDGKINGKETSTGSFVWIMRAEDMDGNVHNLNGNFTLVR